MAVNALEDIKRAIRKRIDANADLCDIYQADQDFDSEEDSEWFHYVILTDVGDGAWISDDHVGIIQFNFFSKLRNEYSLEVLLGKIRTEFLKKRLDTECYSTVIYADSARIIDKIEGQVDFTYRATRPEPI